MLNPISLKLSNELYTSSLWVMRTRWYYSFLIFLLAVLAIPENQFSFSIIPISILFGVSIIYNSILAFYLEHNNSEKIGEINLWRINIGQVIFDLLYIFLMLIFSGSGLNSFIQIFFFLPIIVSMMFFGFRGAIAVSSISGVFLIISIFSETNVITSFLSNPTSLDKILIQSGFKLKIAQGGVMALLYLLAGFFSATVAKLLSSREAELQKQFLEEESNVTKLKELTREFEQSSKLLVRRDIELTVANERMHELDLMKTQIISVAAHQLRTPLSGIKWMIKLILDGDLGELSKDQKEWLKRGFDSNERLIRVVNDLLEVDKLESGRVKYIFKPAKIEDLIERAITSVLPKASQKKIHISFSSTGNIPKLNLDSERITDMLENLIDNAVKYSKENSVVTITLSIIENSARVSISDNGIGIPKDDQRKIFSRFFRSENARQFDTEGTGLGLSIVNNVVSRHAGSISFTSNENEGTTFIVDLPITLSKTEESQSK